LGSFQLVISSVVTTLVYSAILAAVIKLFQIATDLSEIKDLLKDMKRNTEGNPPAAPASALSHASLLRAVSGEAYPDAPVEPLR